MQEPPETIQTNGSTPMPKPYTFSDRALSSVILMGWMLGIWVAGMFVYGIVQKTRGVEVSWEFFAFILLGIVFSVGTFLVSMIVLSFIKSVGTEKKAIIILRLLVILAVPLWLASMFLQGRGLNNARDAARRAAEAQQNINQ